MTSQADFPAFETIYLEIQPRTDGSVPLVNDVLSLFRERSLAGVAVAGQNFGVGTAVIAKLAMTMVDDSALVYTVDQTGNLTTGDFTGEVCEWLARQLNTDVIADEYVLYSPNKEDGAVEFVELDPRRQSIDHPAGFPNEWRVSPQFLRSSAIAYVDGTRFTPQAIANDTDTQIPMAKIEQGLLIEMPSGVVELPLSPVESKHDRVVLFAQAGEAKYAHMVMGKGKKQLRLTIANLPSFAPAHTSPQDSPAQKVLSMISHAALVPGTVQLEHPNFPVHLLPLYERLSDHGNTHSFFSEVAEVLQVPAFVASVADGQFAFPVTGRELVSPSEAPASKKFGLFRKAK